MKRFQLQIPRDQVASKRRKPEALGSTKANANDNLVPPACLTSAGGGGSSAARSIYDSDEDEVDLFFESKMKKMRQKEATPLDEFRSAASKTLYGVSRRNSTSGGTQGKTTSAGAGNIASARVSLSPSADKENEEENEKENEEGNETWQPKFILSSRWDKLLEDSSDEEDIDNGRGREQLVTGEQHCAVDDDDIISPDQVNSSPQKLNSSAATNGNCALDQASIPDGAPQKASKNHPTVASQRRRPGEENHKENEASSAGTTRTNKNVATQGAPPNSAIPARKNTGPPDATSESRTRENQRVEDKNAASSPAKNGGSQMAPTSGKEIPTTEGNHCNGGRDKAQSKSNPEVGTKDKSKNSHATPDAFGPEAVAVMEATAATGEVVAEDGTSGNNGNIDAAKLPPKKNILSNEEEQIIVDSHLPSTPGEGRNSNNDHASTSNDASPEIHILEAVPLGRPLLVAKNSQSDRQVTEVGHNGQKCPAATTGSTTNDSMPSVATLDSGISGMPRSLQTLVKHFGPQQPSGTSSSKSNNPQIGSATSTIDLTSGGDEKAQTKPPASSSKSPNCSESDKGKQQDPPPSTMNGSSEQFARHEYDNDGAGDDDVEMVLHRSHRDSAADDSDDDSDAPTHSSRRRMEIMPTIDILHSINTAAAKTAKQTGWFDSFLKETRPTVFGETTATALEGEGGPSSFLNAVTKQSNPVAAPPTATTTGAKRQPALSSSFAEDSSSSLPKAHPTPAQASNKNMPSQDDKEPQAVETTENNNNNNNNHRRRSTRKLQASKKKMSPSVITVKKLPPQKPQTTEKKKAPTILVPGAATRSDQPRPPPRGSPVGIVDDAPQAMVTGPTTPLTADADPVPAEKTQSRHLLDAIRSVKKSSGPMVADEVNQPAPGTAAYAQQLYLAHLQNAQAAPGPKPQSSNGGTPWQDNGKLLAESVSVGRTDRSSTARDSREAKESAMVPPKPISRNHAKGKLAYSKSKQLTKPNKTSHSKNNDNNNHRRPTTALNERQQPPLATTETAPPDVTAATKPSDIMFAAFTRGACPQHAQRRPGGEACDPSSSERKAPRTSMVPDEAIHEDAQNGPCSKDTVHTQASAAATSSSAEAPPPIESVAVVPTQPDLEKDIVFGTGKYTINWFESPNATHFRHLMHSKVEWYYSQGGRIQLAVKKRISYEIQMDVEEKGGRFWKTQDDGGYKLLEDPAKEIQTAINGICSARVQGERFVQVLRAENHQPPPPSGVFVSMFGIPPWNQFSCPPYPATDAYTPQAMMTGPAAALAAHTDAVPTEPDLQKDVVFGSKGLRGNWDRGAGSKSLSGSHFHQLLYSSVEQYYAGGQEKSTPASICKEIQKSIEEQGGRFWKRLDDADGSYKLLQNPHQQIKTTFKNIKYNRKRKLRVQRKSSSTPATATTATAPSSDATTTTSHASCPKEMGKSQDAAATNSSSQDVSCPAKHESSPATMTATALSVDATTTKPTDIVEVASTTGAGPALAQGPTSPSMMLLNNRAALVGRPKPDPGTHERFPEKLHRMLNDMEAIGKGHIISFVDEGRAFAIHNLSHFLEEIFPLYFTHLAYFKRDLNLYGFKQGGRSRAYAYFHELFQRDKRHLCQRMRPLATANKNKKSAQAGNHASKEPYGRNTASTTHIPGAQQIKEAPCSASSEQKAPRRPMVTEEVNPSAQNVPAMTGKGEDTAPSTSTSPEGPTPQIVSDEGIRDGIVEILPSIDLKTTGVKKFRKMLSKHLGADLSSRACFVEDALMEAIDAMEQNGNK